MDINNAWNISFCAGYIVPPSKGLSEVDAVQGIQGSYVKLDHSIISYFNPLFINSVFTCPITIIFTNTDGKQENEIRERVRQLAFGSQDEQVEHSRALALALGLATDQRSQAGLFITLVGQSSSGLSRVVFFKFPADETLQAIFSDEGLSINVITGAFSRKNDYFKAAVFEGTKASTAFWEGKVEDKQATQRVFEVSDLWVIGFLKALPNLSDERGTRTLAKAIKALLDTVEDAKTRLQIISALTTIKSQEDRSITLRNFADDYLPPSIREQFHKTIEHEVLFDIPFKLEQQVLDKQAGIRTIVLDTGFRVSGPISDFDDPSVYSQRETEDGEIEIRIRGRAIGDRVRTMSRR